MTYLEPEQMQTRVNWRQWATRILAVIAILAIAWTAFTIGGDDGSVRPEIVQEPSADPALSAAPSP